MQTTKEEKGLTIKEDESWRDIQALFVRFAGERE
jgi:hypothetical protein